MVKSTVVNKNTKREEMRAAVSEEIARTYFKLSDRSPARKSKFYWVPWAVTASAILITLIVLVSKSRIDVKIRIVSEVPSVKSAFDGPGGRDMGVWLAKGAQTNSSMVKGVYFLADAKNFSRVTDDQIVLCNSRGNGWASYSIEFKEPLDLRSFNITYTARGEKGGEYLSVALVDSENRSFVIEKEYLPRILKDWRDYKVNFTSVRNAIDLGSIVSIRFEFGTLTTGNSPAATIYLKDVYAVKAKGS
jgi:hypothetical protein